MVEMNIREDFPIFRDNPSLVYLDNAATTQKPSCVIEAVRHFYERDNANPLRGLYDLAQRATAVYEDSREAVAEFIGAAGPEEIVFTRNASESLNLVAYSYGTFLKEGDEILLSVMEHHSNLIPWQQLAVRSGAVLKFIECGVDGRITEEAFRSALSSRTKIVSMTQISNVLGVRNDIRTFARLAAQSVPHIPVDVQDLDVDFLAFSGHKMLAPMGIGVLYGKKALLEKMPPFLTGGEMIEYVTREGATWAELPHKFEAGTVNAAGAVGLKTAIEYYRKVGFDAIQKREEELSEQAFDVLSTIPHLHIMGGNTAKEHNGIFSFSLDGVHPHDIAEILNADGVCIRAGHHCAQVLMQHMNVPSTVRASLAFYNREEDILRLAQSLSTVRRRMGYVE